MKYVAKISKVVYVILTIACIPFTIIPQIDYMNKYIQSNVPWLFVVNLNMLFVTLILGLVLYGVTNRFTKHLAHIGVRGVPCSIGRYYFYWRRKNYINSLMCIHYDIIHNQYQYKKNIISNNFLNLNNLSLQEMVDEILSSYQHILKKITMQDFSLSIQLFTNDVSAEDNDSFLKRNEYIAFTYHRFSSESELQKIEMNQISTMDKDEYVLVKEHRVFKKELFSSLKNQKEANIVYNGKVCRRNSAYDYVISNTNHYWMSNNLKEDEKNANFYCNMAEYGEYYNSLAVFLIAPHYHEGCRTQRENCLGLFTIDSFATNVFIKREMQLIGGLMAHTLYDLFVLVKKNKNGIKIS